MGLTLLVYDQSAGRRGVTNLVTSILVLLRPCFTYTVADTGPALFTPAVSSRFKNLMTLNYSGLILNIKISLLLRNHCLDFYFSVKNTEQTFIKIRALQSLCHMFCTTR